MNKTIFLTAILLTAGCSSTTKGFLKSIEGKAYDTAANSASKYCDNMTGPIATQERLEARREIRQRGTNGPLPTDANIPGLDHQTAYGSGPVIRIWCKGEEVPSAVWTDFVR